MLCPPFNASALQLCLTLYPADKQGNLRRVNGLPTVCIVGPGLIGGSLALAWRAKEHPITVLCRDADEARSAQHLGEASVDPAAVIPQAAYVFLATPVTTFEAQFRRITPHLSANALVSDVGSTKRAAHVLARQILPPGRFIGSHPMAGSEKKGLVHARGDLFHNAPCILTNDSENPASAESLADLSQLWQSLNTRVSYLDPATHDRLLASVSHLPHVLASALVLTQPPGAIPLAGGGFRDATRVSAGDTDMWTGILLANADNLLAAITRFESQTAEVRRLIESNDPVAIRAFLDAARRARLSI